MKRCFQILGLREDATKRQVQEAYTRRAQKYKGADYIDEPEYAHRKLMELKAAYEEAYCLAGEDAGFSSKATVSDSDTKAKSTRLRDAERKEAEHSIGEKFHQWMEKRDEEKTVGKSKAAKQKGKASLKKLDFDKLKESMKAFTEEDDAFDGDFVPTGNGERLNSNGTAEKPKKDDSDASMLIKIICAIFAIVVAFAPSSCEDNDVSFEDYDETVYAYDYLYNYEDISESDLKINALASDTEFVLVDGEESYYSTILDETTSDYMEQSSAFAKNYWGMESIDEVTEYLFDLYEGYPVDNSAPLDEQLDSIFAFYGFMSMEDATWYKNPYLDESIEGYADYLDYLNQYYEKSNENK